MSENLSGWTGVVTMRRPDSDGVTVCNEILQAARLLTFQRWTQDGNRESPERFGKLRLLGRGRQVIADKVPQFSILRDRVRSVALFESSDMGDVPWYGQLVSTRETVLAEWRVPDHFAPREPLLVERNDILEINTG